jgi:hypothetical protein
MTYSLNIVHRPPEDVAFSFEQQLDLVRRLLDVVSIADPTLAPGHWLIATGEREGSYKHLVFDPSGVRQEALAVFMADNKNRKISKSVTIWNGQEEMNSGASLTSRFALTNGRPCSVDLGLTSPPGMSRLGTSAQVLEALSAACKLYKPVCAWISNQFHAYKPVFQDRPGVGWMLYLPRTLTAQQVPEARALVPVTVEDAWKIPHHIGTIIVSVTDEPFDETNSEHARIANAIEIRLVDQDLLPRYADL